MLHHHGSGVHGRSPRDDTRNDTGQKESPQHLECVPELTAVRDGQRGFHILEAGFIDGGDGDDPALPERPQKIVDSGAVPQAGAQPHDCEGGQ